MYLTDEEYAALEPEARDALDAARDAEMEAEIYAENAWLRAAEYDPEAEAFAQYEASLGLL